MRLSDYPMHCAPRCGARTRRGRPCQSPAMPNGRCRMHGGKSRSGREHGRYRHGFYTKQAIESRRAIAELLAESRRTLIHFRRM